MSETEPRHGVPEGANCAKHSERPAAFSCSECGKHVCVFCYHPVAERCEACLQRDPAAAAPPIPWESGDGSVPARFLGTLAGAFRPVFTAPAFAETHTVAARWFFLWSAVPLAALAGVIPQTKTLLFGGSLQVTVQHHASTEAIALDIGIAMLAQLAWFVLDFAALALPYTSLVKAYAQPARHAAALRVLLYRLWLAPAGLLLFFLMLWALPAAQAPQSPPPFTDIAVFFRFFCNAMLFVSMRATARLACGIGPVLSYVVVIVPFVVWALVQPLLAGGSALLGRGS